MRLADLGKAVLAAAQWPFISNDEVKSTGPPLPITISQTWDVLGPFQIGTREAVWGADPLEKYGGFHGLQRDVADHYPSSLAFNGSVTWSQVSADVQDLPLREKAADINIAFPDVNWHLLQQVYGWSALQWQAWARGTFAVETQDDILIWMHTNQVLEFWVDDKHFFGGDVYSFNRAPTVLSLTPGKHTIELRIVRDVRAMGGITDNPNVEAGLHISATEPMLRRGSSVMLPDRLNDDSGPTAGNYASLILRNDDRTTIYVHSVEATHDICTAELVQGPIKLVPGQSSPVAFRVSCIPGTSASASIKLYFHYHNEGSAKQKSLFVWGLPRRPVPITEPHRFTYMHPGGVVSYAIIKPPLVNCPDKNLPVLIALHGAGVEADSDLVKHSLDDLPPLCAWTIMPSGVTSWSGDDWHDWGWADVQAAVNSIPDWIEQVEWEGPGVDTDRWLVTGHSNGGQGTWHAVTHFPDKIIAAAPVSGYSSIQAYVPYSLWRNVDPKITAVIQAVLLGHNNELMLENAAEIPLLIQHGGADDNVPAYHSRLMYSRLQEIGANATFVEVADEPHWWDGVMTTPWLQDFFSEHLEPKSVDEVHRSRAFTIVTSSPGSTGSKGGIMISNTLVPGQLGHSRYSRSEAGDCSLLTENIERLKISDAAMKRCNSLSIDGKVLPTTSGATIAYSVDLKSWFIELGAELNRRPRQQGGLEAILRTNGSFQLVQHSTDIDRIALQVANNLCQYFSADVHMSDSYDEALQAPGNIISIAIGKDLPDTDESLRRCYVTVQHDSISIPISFEESRTYTHARHDLVAAIYLRILPGDRTELVVWAISSEYLKTAARLVPMLTGSGQPDFVVASSKMAYAGAGGSLALGFFDSDWCASEAPSFFR